MTKLSDAIYATGRRKQAAARVWLLEGEKGITVNNADLASYFKRADLQMIILQPLESTGALDQVGFRATVKGGGESGQAGALRHGISRCLAQYNPEFRPVLRKGGFLTRDPREKERKKFGRKGARRRFQYTKR